MWILRAMGRHSVKICTALLWLVSAVAASTDEYYTDLPAATDYYQAQAEDLETALYQPNLSPPYYRQLDDRAYWNKDLLLYKLMKSLQGGASGDESPNQKWEYDYLDSSWPDGLEVKGSDVKRWVTSLSPSPSSKPSKAETAQLQRKWKIKKGRGMPSLCYFKLCTFRRYR